MAGTITLSAQESELLRALLGAVASFQPTRLLGPAPPITFMPSREATETARELLAKIR